MAFSREEKIEILKKDTDYIYQQYLLSNNAYCFSQNATELSINRYDQFKTDVSDLLNLHKYNIGIFGSSKLGFSLNPNNNLSDFTDKSDVDIALISPYHYNLFRKEYLNDFYSGHFKYYKYENVAKGIFRKMIIFDGFQEKNKEYKNWQEITGEFESTIQIKYELSNDINYRIFESWDAVRYYYKNSIKFCKKEFLHESY